MDEGVCPRGSDMTPLVHVDVVAVFHHVCSWLVFFFSSVAGSIYAAVSYEAIAVMFYFLSLSHGRVLVCARVHRQAQLLWSLQEPDPPLPPALYRPYSLPGRSFIRREGARCLPMCPSYRVGQTPGWGLGSAAVNTPGLARFDTLSCCTAHRR